MIFCMQQEAVVYKQHLIRHDKFRHAGNEMNYYTCMIKSQSPAEDSSLSRTTSIHSRAASIGHQRFRDTRQAPKRRKSRVLAFVRFPFMHTLTGVRVLSIPGDLLFFA